MRKLFVGAAIAAAGLGMATPAAAQDAPDPASVALGRRLAEAGEFNAIISAIAQAEVDRVVAEAGELTEAERARLTGIGMRTLSLARERLLDEVGEIYARHLPGDHLAAIVAFYEGPAGRALVAKLPVMLPEIAGAAEDMGVDGEMRRAICRETGKLCPVTPPPAPGRNRR